MNALWPHQQAAIDATQAAIAQGKRRICLSSPTGGGKTRVASDLIHDWTSAGLRTAIYTNRRLLIDQLSRMLTEQGIEHGIRAAGHGDPDDRSVQICSIQTEETRTRNAKVLQGEWLLHPAERVIVDEAHLNASDQMRSILQRHYNQGAAYVGLTATPLGLASLYDHLIQAGTASELRECGALVWCNHYGPDEPDLRALKRLRDGEDLSENQARQAMMTPTIWGRVYDWWKKLNLGAMPTILFAPGVAESIWFAEQFVANGVSAAHIDGQEVWVNGKVERTSRQAREDVLEGSRDGRIRVLCNRFVLREGIDAPWLAHGIFATVFGSLQSYLQAGGRLLRSHPSLDSVTLQDHGGNWWRHGSLNADRKWHLDYTNTIIAGLRARSLRERSEREPFLCPECKIVLIAGRCRSCGWVPVKHTKSRPVVQVDGTLKEMSGDIYRPRRVMTRPDGPARWERMYWRSAKWEGNRTFAQAEALFAQENLWAWPDERWPFMPVDPLDFYRLVKDVPMSRLIQKEVPLCPTSAKGP